MKTLTAATSPSNYNRKRLQKELMGAAAVVGVISSVVVISAVELVLVPAFLGVVVTASALNFIASKN